MQIRQNQSFSAQTLRTHRHLFWECWGVVLLGVLLWLLELFAAALLLRIQDTPPASLLTEQAVPWRIVQVCWLVPAWLAWTVCRWRLWHHCTGAVSLLPRCRPAGTGKRLVLALQNTLLRTLLLQTVTLCLFGAYQLGKTAAHRTEGAPYLFWAVQLLVLGVLCLLGWVYVCLGLWCVPFVCFARPELPPWKVPVAAMQIMHGGRRELLALLGWYWVRFIVLPVDVIKRTKVLNAFAVTWWVNSFPILPAVTGAVLLWYGTPFERRVWGSLLLFIVVSALAGYLTIIRYNHKLKKSQQ